MAHTISSSDSKVITSTTNDTPWEVAIDFDSALHTMSSSPTLEVKKIINTNGNLTYTDDTDGAGIGSVAWYPDQNPSALFVVPFGVTDGGMYRLVVSWSYTVDATVHGDPHITTFDGQNYML